MPVGRNATRVMTLASRAVQHPSWAGAHVENYANQLYERFKKPAWTPLSTVSTVDGLSLAGGWSAPQILNTIALAPQPKRPGSSNLYGNPDGSNELVSIVYALCKLIGPELVIETGVAHGFTTAAVLQALDENAKGTLVSIDLPHLHPRAEESIGAAVEHHLRGRWELHLGPAAATMGSLGTERLADIFIQDAAHTSRGQLSEFRSGWTKLRPGGFLVSDDATEAAERFGEEVGRTPIFVAQPPKRRPLAIIQR